MFDLMDNRMQPRDLNISNSDAYSLNRGLLAFLDTLNSFRLCSTETGKVVYADDQFINQQSMKMSFQQSMKMNFPHTRILNKLVMFSDGQEVIDYFD